MYAKREKKYLAYVLKHNSNREKSDKAPCIIYVDLECVLEKFDGCKNNPENWSSTEADEHILSGLRMSTIPSFKSIENEHDVNRG